MSDIESCSEKLEHLTIVERLTAISENKGLSNAISTQENQNPNSSNYSDSKSQMSSASSSTPSTSNVRLLASAPPPLVSASQIYENAAFKPIDLDNAKEPLSPAVTTPRSILQPRITSNKNRKPIKQVSFASQSSPPTASDSLIRRKRKAIDCWPSASDLLKRHCFEDDEDITISYMSTSPLKKLREDINDSRQSSDKDKLQSYEVSEAFTEVMQLAEEKRNSVLGLDKKALENDKKVATVKNEDQYQFDS